MPNQDNVKRDPRIKMRQTMNSSQNSDPRTKKPLLPTPTVAPVSQQDQSEQPPSNVKTPSKLAEEHPELAYIDNLPVHLRPSTEEIEELKKKSKLKKEKDEAKQKEGSKSPDDSKSKGAENGDKSETKGGSKKKNNSVIGATTSSAKKSDEGSLKGRIAPTKRSSGVNNMPYKLPYDSSRWYVPKHDPRWLKQCPIHNTELSDLDATYLVVNDKLHAVTQGVTQITIDGLVWFIDCDAKKRKVFIRTALEGQIEAVYNIGEPIVHITLHNIYYSIYYRGGLRRLYIDGYMFNVYGDAPPLTLLIAGMKHDIKVNSSTKKVYIDGLAVCQYGVDNLRVGIDSKKHVMRFQPDPKTILFDGQHSEVRFQGQYSYISLQRGRFGIRFDGSPTTVCIAGNSYEVKLDRPKVISLPMDNSRHLIAIGGPSHELIIDGVCHELKFNGPPIEVQIGTRILPVQLQGSVPTVKLLGEFLTDNAKIAELCQDEEIDPMLAVEAVGLVDSVSITRKLCSCF